MPKKINSAICAIVKNEGRYVLEWLAYHRLIGIDHIFLYDNESSDDTFEKVKPYITEGFVTFISWPSNATANPQRLAYDHFAAFFSSIVEWLIYLDGDEFINLKRHNNIADFLKDYAEISGVAINWRMFGDGGKSIYQPGLVVERFQQASSVDFFGNGQVKTFVRCADMQHPDMHNPKMVDGKVTLTANLGTIEPYPRAWSDQIHFDIAQINHYFVKSREEWSIKRLRGKADVGRSATGRLRSDEEFGVYNRNEDEEISILTRLDDLKSELSRVELLRIPA